MQSVIKSIVGPHQTCGIRNRTILSNIHIARSILECCDANLECVAMVQLDLEKAFDRVAHSILLALLKHINVGEVIQDGVAMAYENCSAHLIINKRLSENIPVLSSVRQGCPLSPLLLRFS